MIRIIFYRNHSPYWPLAEETAGAATSHTVKKIGTLEQHDCTFADNRRHEAAALLGLVYRWKAVRVYMNDDEVDAPRLVTLHCYLSCPSCPTDRIEYCRGRGDDSAPPCKRLLRQGVGITWVDIYGKAINARAARVDLSRILRDGQEALYDWGVASCPAYFKGSFENWMSGLTDVIELPEWAPPIG